MDLLPELLKTALTSACNSGRCLSWKLQESGRGTLIQLVWKHELETSPVCGKPTGVGSYWKHLVVIVINLALGYTELQVSFVIEKGYQFHACARSLPFKINGI